MADEYKTLFARLKEYSGENPVPMHMPGHKRNVPGIAFLEQLGAKYDITEIEGFDDLHAPQGILQEAMDRAAETWGSDRCFFLVNGSTGGVLAAVRAVSKPGGKLIMARNSHKSVYNAAELCELEPVYLRAPSVDGFGFCASIPIKAVEIAVRDNPGTPVILTSPTYEGVISNISEIAVICHLYGSPLIVDEAHGAHLDLSGAFTGGAVRAGADIVVQSLHKTLTGLTQTGLLHVSGGLVSPDAVAAQLAVFESSSPSYLLMASIDGTAELIRQRGGSLFKAWENRLDSFDRRIQDLKTLRVPGHGEYFDCQFNCRMAGFARQSIAGEQVYDYDRSKIVISCEGTDTTGVALMERLREEYGIECEMAAGGYVVAMTGIGDTDGALERLAAAIIELDVMTCRTLPRVPFSPPVIPPRCLSIKKTLQQKTQSLFLRDAKGRIAAEYVWAYPPGIPLVVPGEILTGELLTSFSIQRETGVKLRSTSGGMPTRIAVVKET